MPDTKARAPELKDFCFATARSRRLTRPNLVSASASRKLVQTLGWMSQLGRPNPASWLRRHLASAVAPSTRSDTPAGRGFTDLAATVLAEENEAVLQALRAEAINCYARERQLRAVMMRYRHWKPEVEISGDVSQTRRHGENRPVVYWTDNTVFAPLVGRMALHSLGVRLDQFSDHVHGDGHTWLGKLTLQRMNFALENRFTVRRIISGPSTHFHAVRELAKSAGAGRAVFMNNNAFIGRRFACTRIGESSWFVQATAPLAMARHYNAAIVPVTVLETTPFEQFSVQFHQPLEADKSLARDDDIRRMALHSTQRQMAAIRQHPEQWLCWTGGQFAQPVDGKLHRPAM